jgi:hypothetical protein
MHLAESSRVEQPLVEIHAVLAQRMLEALIWARAVPVKRDGESGYAHLRHAIGSLPQ